MFKFIKNLFFGANKKNYNELIKSATKVTESINNKLDRADKSKDVSLRNLLLVEIRQEYAELSNAACKFPAGINLSNIANFESAIKRVEEETDSLERESRFDSILSDSDDIYSENDKKIFTDTIKNHLRIINESISIACQSKNIETIKYRVDIARNTLKKAIDLARQYSIDIGGFSDADKAIKMIEEALQTDDPLTALSKLDIPIEQVISSPAREKLKEATVLKKQKKYLEACEKLKQAYLSPGSENFMIEDRLRLPMYLLLGGKGEEGWQEMMRLREKYTDYFSKIKIKSQIEIFCRKEGKNRAIDDLVELEDSYDDTAVAKQISDWQHDDVVIGLKFYANLNLDTPLRVLRRHGEIHKHKTRNAPTIAKKPSEGVWLPVTEIFHEMEINFPELFQDSTMSSCFGQIPVDGGDYLKFLIAIREIVEKEAKIEDRITELIDLAHSSTWKNFDGWEFGGKRSGYEWLIDNYFPYYFDKKLRDAGFNTPNRIIAASDQELLSVKGIGPATLKKIRKQCEGITQNLDIERYDDVSR